MNTSSASQTFSENSLAGKQIWHITAPANIPLSSINELAMDCIKSGDPILDHKGVNYFLAEERSETTNHTIFVPREEGFRPLSRPVDKVLHLRQKVVLPNLSKKQSAPETGSNAAGEVSQVAISSIRPQPKGLKMRYRPPGFGTGETGKIGGSESEREDVEMADATPVKAFRLPKGAGKEEAVESGEKKKKKKRKEKRRDSESKHV